MTGCEIVREIAEARLVEELAGNIARVNSFDRDELVAITYEALLTTEEARLNDLRKNGHLRYYIARILLNQYNSTTSTYHAIVGAKNGQNGAIFEDKQETPEDLSELMGYVARLSEPDRIIITLYAEHRSCRKLGALLHTSAMTACNQVHRIRRIIKEMIKADEDAEAGRLKWR